MTRKLRAMLAIGALLAGLAPAVAAGKGAPAAPAQDGVAVVLPSGTRLDAEVVTTPEERARGLMFRRDEEFPESRAMVFFFEEPEILSFWMKNMNFAIDIVWLASDGRIVHVEREAPPCQREPCPNYTPMQKAQTVVELHRGIATKEGLKLGDRIAIVGPDGEPLGP